ncbi:MAG: carboxyl transferase domain-containing protein, partial [Planctomycetota bacterium]
MSASAPAAGSAAGASSVQARAAQRRRRAGAGTDRILRRKGRHPPALERTPCLESAIDLTSLPPHRVVGEEAGSRPSEPPRRGYRSRGPMALLRPRAPAPGRRNPLGTPLRSDVLPRRNRGHRMPRIQSQIHGIGPPDPHRPFEAREVIARIADGSLFAEFKRLYGTTLVCGFARV